MVLLVMEREGKPELTIILTEEEDTQALLLVDETVITVFVVGLMVMDELLDPVFHV